MTQQFHWVQAHTKETRERETGTPTFMAALCAIRPQNQPKGPATEEWMKTMWYVYTSVLGFITVFFAAPRLCTVLQGT